MTRVAIVGFAQTDHGEHPELHVGEMVHQVAWAALSDAGISRDEVDVVVNASDDVVDGRSISNVFLVEAMGGFLKEEAKVEEDGAFALFYAWTRLLAGPNRVALVVAHSKMNECPPDACTGMMAEPFYSRPVGLRGLTAAALQASAWMHRHGVGEATLARVAAQNRRHGARNPCAQLRTPVSVDEALASEVLASPLTSAECPPATDGAAAVVLAVEARAREFARRPVWIEGAGLSHDLYYAGHRDLTRLRAAQEAARRAAAAAGLRDLALETDFAELSGGYAHQDLMLYEALGLAPEGGGRRLLEEGATALEGRYPVNPSGGPLCADPGLATGLVRIGEAARQLAGRAGPCQLPRPVRRGLAHAAGGLALQSHALFVLAADGGR